MLKSSLLFSLILLAPVAVFAQAFEAKPVLASDSSTAIPAKGDFGKSAFAPTSTAKSSFSGTDSFAREEVKPKPISHALPAKPVMAPVGVSTAHISGPISTGGPVGGATSTLAPIGTPVHVGSPVLAPGGIVPVATPVRSAPIAAPVAVESTDH